MSPPRETGSGLPWLDYQVARAASARPTGVPLTADNAVDAAECMDTTGYRRRWKRGPAGWTSEGGRLTFSDAIMVTTAPGNGTVVTKWRE